MRQEFDTNYPTWLTIMPSCQHELDFTAASLIMALQCVTSLPRKVYLVNFAASNLTFIVSANCRKEMRLNRAACVVFLTKESLLLVDEEKKNIRKKRERERSK